jgi:hypothetical protein
VDGPETEVRDTVPISEVVRPVTHEWEAHLSWTAAIQLMLYNAMYSYTQHWLTARASCRLV